MIASRKRRLYFVLFLLVGVSVAVAFSLYALRQNINLYLTPTKIKQQTIAPNLVIRLGGVGRKAFRASRDE